ncbi:MAG: hypothetical protein GY749_20935 [Desulfobacteraceae bacterium]|nr:hypothetical protein [Desulfobacteraceae bacterium]
MKKSFVLVLVLVAIAVGCSTLTMDTVKDVSVDVDKVYNVIFEKKPPMVKEGIFSKDIEIGKVLSQQLAADNMAIAKISVKKEYASLMKSNVVFYVKDGRLEYEKIGEQGELLSEGAKILGFPGKTSLTWFKTKNKVKNLSNAAVDKAEELYNKAVK